MSSLKYLGILISCPGLVQKGETASVPPKTTEKVWAHLNTFYSGAVESNTEPYLIVL